MANEQNLVRNEDRTPEERRANARKAGIASGKARRERKNMQELARIVLDMPYECGEVEEIEGLDFDGSLDANLTVGQRALLAVAKKAMRGDAGALAFLRDTAGEKPAEKVEVSGNVEEAAASIRSLIEKRKSEDAK